MTDVLKLPNGDIIREGEYGVTRDGQKVGPIVRNDCDCASAYWIAPDDLLDQACPAWYQCGSYFPATNPLCDATTLARDIVAKWVAEPAEEIGTLAELKVQIGDVVQNVASKKEYAIGMDCRGESVLQDINQGYIAIAVNKSTSKYQIVTRANPPLPYGHAKMSDGSIWDMTADKQYTFGMLTDEHRAAMRDHGGPYGYWSVDDWQTASPSWIGHMTYRVTPKQPRQTVINREMYMTRRGCVASNARLPCATPVTITYDTIDGVIDYATYKVEAR